MKRIFRNRFGVTILLTLFATLIFVAVGTKAIAEVSMADSLSLPVSAESSAIADEVTDISDDYGIPATYGEPFELWERGNEAYARGDYDVALENYSEIEKEGYVSAPLFFNMGNTYFRLDRLGKAILYYERALEINPSYADAKANLALAQGVTVDKIDEVPEFIIITWCRNLRNILSSNEWALIALLFLAIALLLMLLFRFAGSTKRKKISFIFACLFFFLMLCSFLFSATQAHNARSSDSAIVTALVGNVKSAPNTTGNSIFVLHEGTKAKVLEEVAGWKKIEIRDGRQGWIDSDDIEVI